MLGLAGRGLLILGLVTLVAQGRALEIPSARFDSNLGHLGIKHYDIKFLFMTRKFSLGVF